jgi:hypothetical protein
MYPSKNDKQDGSYILMRTIDTKKISKQARFDGSCL